MEPINIVYRIKLKDRIEVFDFVLDSKTFELLNPPSYANPPEWAELGYRQCSHCPLEPDEHPHCPMALQLHDIVERLHDTRSIDEVELEVQAQDRRFLQTTALQHVLSSMLGLITPICGCPKAAYMRPLARFHLPLANEEETVFRVAGMYLLAQYFLIQNGKGGKFAFDGLIRIYEDLHEVNKAVASRLQLATASDSVKNAITLIDMYCTLIPMLLEDQMVEIRNFFKAYLPEGEPEPAVRSQNLLEKARAFVIDMDASKLSLVSTDDDSSRAPAWLRVLQDEDGGGAADSAPAEPAGTSTVDEILSKSPLKLELEPVADPHPAAPASGRAVFILPDDDLPPLKPGKP